MDDKFRILGSAYQFHNGNDNENSHIYSILGPLLIYMLGMIATTECFMSYFNPSINRLPLYGMMLLIMAINYCIFYWKEHGLYIAIGYVLLTIFMLGVNWTKVINGICAVFNGIFMNMGKNENGDFIRFNYIGGETPHPAWGLIIFVMVFATLLAFAVFQNHILCGAVVVLAASTYGTFVNVMPNIYWLAGAMAFLAGLVVMNKGKSVKIWCVGSLGAFVLTAAAFILVMAVTPVKQFERLPVFQVLNEVVDDVSDTFKRLLGISDKTGESGTGGAALGISGGRLPNLDVSKAEIEKVFTLTSFEPETDFYLRGYVGAVYTGTGWENIGKEALGTEAAQRYAVLSERTGINAYNQSYYIDTLISESRELSSLWDGYLLAANRPAPAYTSGELTVRLTGEMTYYCFPYGAALFDGNAVLDTELNHADGYPLKPPLATTYQCVAHRYKDYDLYKNLVDTYIGTNFRLLKYMQWERAYREFIKENYTDIDERVFENVDLSELDKIDVTSQEGVDEYVRAVEAFLESYRYTLSPEASSDADFINHFLADSKEGYCTSFASAGVALLRRKGIPARYVEGFLIEKDKILSGEKGVGSTVFADRYYEYNSYTVDVYTECAHAWAEIYKEGYGWVPVEFTVGYLEDEQTGETQEIPTEDESNDEGDDGDDGDEEDDGEETSTEVVEDSKATGEETGISIIFIFLTVVAVLLSLIVLVAAVILLCNYVPKRRRLVRLLHKNTKGASPGRINTMVIDLYLYMEKVMAEKGCVRAPNEDYSQFEKAIGEKFQCFTEKEISDIIEIVLKARFSQGELTGSELESVRRLAIRLRREIYNNAKGADRLILKYVKVY